MAVTGSVPSRLPPFQRLVDAHWRDVARVAAALAGPGDGEDVAQQAWTQALAAYPSMTSLHNPRGWLLTIVARCATDAHRARTRRPLPVESLPDDGAGSIDAPPTADDDLWDAVRALPERQRTAVVLRYVADLDHAAVAAALRTTPAATRRLVSDALAVLRAAGVTTSDSRSSRDSGRDSDTGRSGG